MDTDVQAVEEEVGLYDQLEDILEYISLSSVATGYFGKSKQWLYQRVKGYSVNGKPAAFTEEEKRLFVSALLDISKKIKSTALKI